MMTPGIFGESLFDDLFDDFFDFSVFDDKAIQKAQKKLYGRHAANMMKTDVQEHSDHYEVDIDLPGFRKEELSLELKDGYLVISASKGIDKDEKEKKTGKFVRRERYAGSMSRSFYVGEDVKREDIRARYESGVLKLCIPKAEQKEPEVEEKKYIAIEG
ncbi:Hsp20/alpha crystallin family protein [Ruminococcus sp. OA3]|uniref:Hsp20/alpha crystallin family protein n=1 Tax=Ruminococcus sp. OA3 TaxID=2914164 RepID=UPI001F06E11E|nr:Hsp20/alpha crystallin family protein [Ruminococcus sp. OA3]MCH1984008.1 Hsp20/alpha crystallin family protein [Ruminococcus sp. OA3]